MSQAIDQGYVTYDALNAAMPADHYTSEEIEAVVDYCEPSRRLVYF
jgi:hypothetical protein